MVSATSSYDLFSFLNKTSQELAQEFHNIPDACFETSHQAKSDGRFATGTQEENLARNRYNNIIANDTTRVKLNGREENDNYINANYALNKRIVIAQAPLDDGQFGYDNHQKDFWDMVWQEKTNAIWMLTDYIEKNIIKSSRYLGHGDGQLSIDKYTISVIKDESEETKDLRSLGFQISKVFLAHSDGESRKVIHYHLPQWQDQSATHAKTLLAAARTLLNGNKPVVHCSAGIGRSGTLALAARTFEKITEGQVGPELIQETLVDLRQERHGSVQTFAQYQSVYDAVKLFADEECWVKI